MPIVEPEVLMDGDHDIDRCYEVTQRVLNKTFQELRVQRVALEGMILKPNMAISGKKCGKQAGVEEVAEKTIRLLKSCVPAAVPGIAFLSGGQSDEEATAHLDAMNRIGGLPWKLTFSYGRALQAAPQKAWSGKAENVARRPAGLHPSRADEFARKQRRVESRSGTEKGGLSFMATNPPRRARCRASISRRRSWTIPRRWSQACPALLAGADVAAVLLRLKSTDPRSMISRIKALAPAVQNGGAALLIDGNAELVARAGADGAHLTGIDAMQDALPTLKPDRIAGVGGLITRHDSMARAKPAPTTCCSANRMGAEQRPSADAIAERLQWWAELFEPPCVGFAASFDEASEFAGAGADFVLVGDLIWADPRGAAAALMDAGEAIRQSHAR